MGNEQVRYTVEELADAVGVSVRTVRFYIAEGLLPGPDARGPGATGYTEEHLQRLRLVRRLVEQHVPLAEVRARLAGLAVDDVRSILTEEDRRSERRRAAEGDTSPRAYVAELLTQARTARRDRRLDEPPMTRAAAPLPVAALPVAEEPAPTPAATWRRWPLAEGVELHVRADVERRQRPLIRRLLDAARVPFTAVRSSDR
jgi:DNA-binding transcriptional MerR regulator